METNIYIQYMSILIGLVSGVITILNHLKLNQLLNIKVINKHKPNLTKLSTY